MNQTLQLGDFGLARNQYDDLENPSENSVVGTLGYVAPEYAEFGKASTKTDVYSFGVVLLQLITGRRTTEKSLGARSLVEWVKTALCSFVLVLENKDYITYIHANTYNTNS